MVNYTSGPATINGLKVFESFEMVEYAGEDWSGVRSPARARRRRKKHRQNIKALYKPMEKYIVMNGAIYAHPEMVRKLLAAVKEQNNAG